MKFELVISFSIDGLHLTSRQPCWCTEHCSKMSFGSLTLLLCKTCGAIFCCFVHQHGRLITWMQTTNRLFGSNTCSSSMFNFKTRRSMSVHWVACGTCYSKTEGTELGGIELHRSSQIFQVGVIKTI